MTPLAEAAPSPAPAPKPIRAAPDWTRRRAEVYPDQPLPESALGRLIRAVSGRHEDAERLGLWDGAKGLPPRGRARFRGCGRGAAAAYRRGYERGRLWAAAP